MNRTYLKELKRKLATPWTRKKAIEELAKLGTDDAVKELIRWANGGWRLWIYDYSPKDQCEALCALSSMQNLKALDYVIDNWKLEDIRQDVYHIPAGWIYANYSNAPNDEKDWAEESSISYITATPSRGKGKLAKGLRSGRSWYLIRRIEEAYVRAQLTRQEIINKKLNIFRGY